MTLSESPASLKKFSKTPWKLQQTFRPPHRKLHDFTAAVVSACQPCQSACLTLDMVTNGPTSLIGLFKSHPIPPQFGHGWSIAAEGQTEIEAALYAALCDCVDFIFVPKPTPFAILADHDEYTTFYAPARPGR